MVECVARAHRPPRPTAHPDRISGGFSAFLLACCLIDFELGTHPPGGQCNEIY